jgi:hypothetical protein
MISIWHLDLKNVPKWNFKRGKLVHSQNLVIDINREIQEVEQGKTFKYLGIEKVKAYSINKRKKD